MERFPRLTMTIVAVVALSACAMEPREGPPAPIVQVSPRDAGPAHRRAVEPYLEERDSGSEASPEAEPAPKPKPKTKVFAYKDPNVPDPEEEAEPAEQAQVAMIDPQSVPSPEGATAPRQPEPPKQPAAKPPKPEKPDLRSKGPVSEDPSPQRQITSPTRATASTVGAPNLPPAAQALASQAERQRQAGDYTGAAASLERSLRISPRESYLWNRLARVRMEQGQAEQAGNLAARSNDLAGKAGEVKKDNWRIIAEAKRRAGDAAGAADAEKQAGSD